MKSSSPMNTKKEEESEENLSSTNVEGVQAGRSPQGEQKQEVTIVEGIDAEEKQSLTTPIMDKRSTASMKKLEKYLRKQATVV